MLRNTTDALDCFHHRGVCLPVACCYAPFSTATFCSKSRQLLRAFLENLKSLLTWYRVCRSLFVNTGKLLVLFSYKILIIGGNGDIHFCSGLALFIKNCYVKGGERKQHFFLTFFILMKKQTLKKGLYACSHTSAHVYFMKTACYNQHLFYSSFPILSLKNDQRNIWTSNSSISSFFHKSITCRKAGLKKGM